MPAPIQFFSERKPSPATSKYLAATSNSLALALHPQPFCGPSSAKHPVSSGSSDPSTLPQASGYTAHRASSPSPSTSSLSTECDFDLGAHSEVVKAYKASLGPALKDNHYTDRDSVADMATDHSSDDGTSGYDSESRNDGSGDWVSPWPKAEPQPVRKKFIFDINNEGNNYRGHRLVEESDDDNEVKVKPTARVPAPKPFPRNINVLTKGDYWSVPKQAQTDFYRQNYVAAVVASDQALRFKKRPTPSTIAPSADSAPTISGHVAVGRTIQHPVSVISKTHSPVSSRAASDKRASPPTTATKSISDKHTALEQLKENTDSVTKAMGFVPYERFLGSNIHTTAPKCPSPKQESKKEIWVPSDSDCYDYNVDSDDEVDRSSSEDSSFDKLIQSIAGERTTGQEKGIRFDSAKEKPNQKEHDTVKIAPSAAERDFNAYSVKQELAHSGINHSQQIFESQNLEQIEGVFSGAESDTSTISSDSQRDSNTSAKVSSDEPSDDAEDTIWIPNESFDEDYNTSGDKNPIADIKAKKVRRSVKFVQEPMYMEQRRFVLGPRPDSGRLSPFSKPVPRMPEDQRAIREVTISNLPQRSHLHLIIEQIRGGQLEFINYVASKRLVTIVFTEHEAAFAFWNYVNEHGFFVPNIPDDHGIILPTTRATLEPFAATLYKRYSRNIMTLIKEDHASRCIMLTNVPPQLSAKRVLKDFTYKATHFYRGKGRRSEYPRPKDLMEGVFTVRDQEVSYWKAIGSGKGTLKVWKKHEGTKAMYVRVCSIRLAFELVGFFSSAREYHNVGFGFVEDHCCEPLVPPVPTETAKSCTAENHKVNIQTPTLDKMEEQPSMASSSDGSEPEEDIYASHSDVQGLAVFLTNLPPSTTAKELTDLIRGGGIHSLGMCGIQPGVGCEEAVVLFKTMEHAIGYVEYCSRHPIVIGEWDVKVYHGIPGRIIETYPHIIDGYRALPSFVTRCLILDGHALRPNQVIEGIHHTVGGAVPVIHLKTAPGITVVMFASVLSAMIVHDALKKNEHWKSVHIDYYADPCSGGYLEIDTNTNTSAW